MKVAYIFFACLLVSTTFAKSRPCEQKEKNCQSACGKSYNVNTSSWTMCHVKCSQKKGCMRRLTCSVEVYQNCKAACSHNAYGKVKMGTPSHSKCVSKCSCVNRRLTNCKHIGLDCRRYCLKSYKFATKKYKVCDSFCNDNLGCKEYQFKQQMKDNKKFHRQHS